MKKIKRLTALIVVLAIALSAMSFTVYATEPEVGEYETHEHDSEDAGCPHPFSIWLLKYVVSCGTAGGFLYPCTGTVSIYYFTCTSCFFESGIDEKCSTGTCPNV